MSIKLKLSKTLIDLLSQNGIDAKKDYKPAYGGESIGLDLYYAGKEPFHIVGTKHYKKDLSESKVLIPTGVHIALPLGYGAFIKDRGSISKTEFIRRAGVVDPGYTDEIFVNLATLNKHAVTIMPGEKLPVQLVIVKTETNFEVIDDAEYDKYVNKSKRKDGKTGSSDTK